MRAWTILCLLPLVCACERHAPAAGKPKLQAGQPGQKCPDPNLRDRKDPCSPMYLTPIKKRFKRESL